MFKASIKTTLIDLSGTLHIEDSPIFGAVEALEKLRKYTNVRFVTNTTKESINKLHGRLLKCGFKIEKDEIFTSLSSARKLIESEKLRPFLILDDDAMEDFEGIETSNPNAVVIGLAPKKFNNETMNKAFRLIKDQNAQLIAIHKGRYYQKNDGLHLGPGAYVTGLEYSTGIQAKVVGKPNRMFFEMALSSLKSENNSFENTVMIGDDVNDDVIGAIENGLNAILVKTGKYREGDEIKIPIDNRNVVKSFVEAVELIVNHVKQ